MKGTRLISAEESENGNARHQLKGRGRRNWGRSKSEIGRKKASGQISPGKLLINGMGNRITAMGQAKAKAGPLLNE